MDTLYQGVISYERIKNLIGVGIFVILSLIGVFCCISALMNPESKTITKLNNPILNTPSNTPSNSNIPDTITTTSGYSPFAWLYFTACAIVCALFAFLSYYLATSKAAEPLLAAQGALDAASLLGHAFRGHGSFNIGE